MKIGYYQFSPLLGDKEANLKRVRLALEKTEFDLILLPELFNVGYFHDSVEKITELSEPIPDGETVRMLTEIAEKKKAYIVGGIAEKEDKALYNTAVVIGPEGIIGKQRKIHLTEFEKKFFLPGNEIELFEIGETKIGIAICFDIFFPEYSRILAKKGIELLLHPACFGGKDSLDIIRVRALENKIYTLTANRTGKEITSNGEAEYRGESRIISPEGEIVAFSEEKEDIMIIETDPRKANSKEDIICKDYRAEWNRYDITQTKI